MNGAAPGAGASYQARRRGAVCITKRAAPATGLAGAVTHVTVESAARMDGGDLVRLRGHVGDLWG